MANEQELNIYDTKRISGKLISELEMDSEEAVHIEELVKAMGYVKWDREKVARYLFKKRNGFPNARFYANWEDEVQACSLTGEEYLTIADQLKEELGKEGG